MEKNRIIILGIGNVLMQDEGVGVHALHILENEYEFEPKIELVDGGTSGSELYRFFEDNDKMIIIDAVEFDEEPGFIGVIKNDDILRKLRTKLSMHHLGLTDVLSNAKLMGIEPEEIVLIGLQPFKMELNTELTPLLKEKLFEALSIVNKQLKSWGITVKKKMSKKSKKDILSHKL